MAKKNPKEPEWFIEIVEYGSDKVVKKLGPVASEKLAEKLDRSANINLNHARYYTRFVEPSA